MRIRKILGPGDRYYNIIKKNSTFHLKPHHDIQIDHIKINDAWIKVYNPDIIIDESSVKIIYYELNQERVIVIDNLGIGGNTLAEVSISVEDVRVENPYIVIWIYDWTPLLNDKNRRTGEILYVD